MRNRIVQSVFLVGALFVASAIPAAAQTASVGVTFLGDGGGTGVAADYANHFRDMNSDRSLDWLVDLSFNHKSDSVLGFDASLNTLIAQVGIRVAGKAGDKATWHVQGAVGFAHRGAGGDLSDVCEILGANCSDNTGVFTPAGALTYWFSSNKGVKGQLGIPVFFSGGGSTTRFDISFVWKMGK